jgi:hypothetical protein
MKRGTIKAFREYLNAKFAGSGVNHHSRCGNRIFQQKTRGYGDYLYFQDREKFDVELADALAGHEGYEDFNGVDSGKQTP